MWKLGTLQPGQAQILTYQVLHKRGGEYKTISDVWSPDLANVSHATAESSTKVMVPALQLALTGTAAVSAKSPAQFTATVKNSGTMPLERVQVALELPDDVLVSRVTSGAQRSKDRIVWTVPKLPPGESQEFRAWVELERGASGRKVITAKARDGQQRTEVVTKEATAEFQGASDLRWAPKFDSPRVELNRQGTVTVVVRNEGSETEKGIQLRVRLPQVLKPEADDRSGDKVTLVNDEAIFNLKELQPGKSHEFRLDYTGAKVGEGEVELILVGETLKDKALTKKQTIQVLNRK